MTAFSVHGCSARSSTSASASAPSPPMARPCGRRKPTAQASESDEDEEPGTVSAADASCGPLRNGYHEASMRASSTAQSSRTSHPRERRREGSCDTPCPEPARPADTFEAHMTSRPFLAAAAALLLATLAAPPVLHAQSGPSPTPGKPVFGTFGIDTAQMDPAVKPGDDFFKYVNGKWLATFKIPADKASYGAFDLLNDKAEEDVRALLGDLGTSHPAPGSVGQKVIDLYQSWMDEAAIDARGITPLDADFKAIAAATSKADITRLMGRID